MYSFKILQLRWVVLCIFTYRIFSFWTCSVLSMLYNYMCQENVNGSLVRNKYFFEISPKKYFRRILYQIKQPYIFFLVSHWPESTLFWIPFKVMFIFVCFEYMGKYSYFAFEWHFCQLSNQINFYMNGNLVPYFCCMVVVWAQNELL